MMENQDKNRICVIAGMPRASTTFLYHTLDKHPSCFMPARKELEYFSLNEGRGADWYYDFFADTNPAQVGFDISPMYFFAEGAPEKIKAFFTRPKVVLIVRDPAEFAMSFYRNRVAADGPGLEFEAFLSGYQYHKDDACIEMSIGPGVLMSRIEAFRNCLADDLLLIDFRLIQNAPVRALQAIERFCGIEAYFSDSNFDNVKVNASDQLNIKFINRLMHKKWFADTVAAVVPKKLIMAVRYRLQTAKRSGAAVVAPDVETRYAQETRAKLAQDAEYIDSLFSGSPLVLGSGQAF